MRKEKYIICGDKSYAINLKAASASFISAIVSDHYPVLNDTLLNNTSYAEGVTRNNLRLHGLVDKVEEAVGTVVMIVRDPVQRFRSACGEMGLTAAEGLVSDNEHFRSASSLLKDGTKLYRFESDLSAAATELGLTLPLPNIPSTGTKPVLTTDELAQVKNKYADDIILHNSITQAGQLWSNS